MNRLVCGIMIVAAALEGTPASAQSMTKHPLSAASLRGVVAHEVTRLQARPQPPPRPADIIPTLPSGRRHCSKIKGVSIGAGVGAAAGMAAGAIAGNPNDIGGRRLPALAFGIFGAGIGAITGLAYCRG